jgi:ABC-type multidrug transport system fused ATPase/permease subunit
MFSSKKNHSISWLDTVPISRIITRFSQDCATIDGNFGEIAMFTTMLIMNLFISFLTVIISSGWPSVPPAIIVAVVIIICSHLYINAQMPVKRNMSNNRAPILGHLSTVLNGISKCYCLFEVTFNFYRHFSFRPCLWSAGGLQRGVSPSYRYLLTNCG